MRSQQMSQYRNSYRCPGKDRTAGGAISKWKPDMELSTDNFISRTARERYLRNREGEQECTPMNGLPGTLAPTRTFGRTGCLILFSGATISRQWKKVRTRYKIFRAFHLPEWQVHKMANCRKGTWRAAEMLNTMLTKAIIVDKLGYPSMTAHYLKVRVNY